MIDVDAMENKLNAMREIMIYTFIISLVLTLWLALTIVNCLLVPDTGYFLMGAGFALIVSGTITYNIRCRIKKYDRLDILLTRFRHMSPSCKIKEIFKILLHINLNLPSYKKHIKGKEEDDNA